MTHAQKLSEEINRCIRDCLECYGVCQANATNLSGVQISLSGPAESDAELSGYYDKLAAAGTVVEPLVTAPWGDKFGMVTDPFGILWMVNISGAQQE